MDWTFLRAVLTKLGLGPNMLAWMASLYGSTEARVRLNGVLSDSCPICNGMRQGCPLPPLIFALSLEPMLKRLRLNPNIKWLNVGSIYADDVLFYISVPLISLPNIMAELQNFNEISNFKINYNKSEILPLNISWGLMNTAAILLFMVQYLLEILRYPPSTSLLSIIYH